MEYDNKTRSTFNFYRSYFEAVEVIPEPSQRAALYRAICAYMLDGTPAELSTEAEPLAAMAWALILPTLNRAKTRAENGRKGGAPKGSRNNPNGRKGNAQRTNQELTETNQELTETNQELTETNPRITNNELRITNNELRITNTNNAREGGDDVFNFRPTFADVMAEAQAANVPTETARRFFEYYAASNWETKNGEPLRNWAAMLQAWAKKDRANTQAEADRAATGLGVGEFFRADGSRTYGTGRATIPQAAPPRPSEAYTWNAETGAWIIL